MYLRCFSYFMQYRKDLFEHKQNSYSVCQWHNILLECSNLEELYWTLKQLPHFKERKCLGTINHESGRSKHLQDVGRNTGKVEQKWALLKTFVKTTPTCRNKVSQYYAHFAIYISMKNVSHLFVTPPFSDIYYSN